MRRLYYMGLEPYKDRYTLQLEEWNKTVFERRGLQYIIVPGDTLSDDKSIVTGQVLDAHGRSYFGMSQIMNLILLMKAGEVNNEDVVFFEDMFQPGIESLPYILNQVDPAHRPRIFVRCLAQSIDPDDFVHVWGMSKWMGLYEKMVNEFVDGVLATNEEMVMHMKVAGWTAPIYNISGLAFNSLEVRGRIEHDIKPFNERAMRVAFASRWDQEKQPDFYMDLIEEWHSRFGNNVEFVVYCGSTLRSNNSSYMKRTKKLQKEGKLTVFENLDKNMYYKLLNDTRILFNCALQDWVSNTASEADALGCNLLFPAYRSFPEAFANDYTRMYIPWNIEDAINKMHHLLINPHHQGTFAKHNDGTVDRIIDIFEGKGEHMLRAEKDYRKHVREFKY